MSGEPKGLRRPPKAVTKPRVGNPWRESVHGPVGVPVMRVRGGAPSGMPTPSWQADGAPRELRSPVSDGAPELRSIDVAYALDARPDYDLQGVSEHHPHIPTARDRYPVGRPFGAQPQYGDSVKGVCAVDAPVMGPRIVHPFVSRMERFATATYTAAVAACVQWETAHARALDALYDTAPSHVGATDHERTVIGALRVTADALRAELPSVHRACEETVTLAREAYPDTRGERTIAPRALVPYDPTRETDLHGRDPNARWEGPTRRDAISWDNAIDPGHRTRELLRAEADIARAIESCPWCDSVTCDHARDRARHCMVYDRALARKLPQALAYVAAREAFKAPRRAHRAALEWIEDGRQATIRSLRALDARGADIDYRGSCLSTDTLSDVRYRDAGVCSGAPIGHRIDQRNHRAYDTARVDGCHWRLAWWQTLQETLASASAGKVDAASEALSMVANAAPRGVWWASELLLWRTTRDAHNGASIRLVQALRATRDTTVYRVVPSRWEDTTTRHYTTLEGRHAPIPCVGRDVVPNDARASSVVAAPRAKLPAGRPLAVCEPAFSALRPATGRVVAPDDVARIVPRQWGDAPAYPVAPRDRTTDNPSTVSPVAHDGRYYRDPSIEELSQRARRP